MPLHLLGKKSWNVYNSDNVERVRRDEAEAQAEVEAEEQRMQEEDAKHRTAILRGHKAPSPVEDHDAPPPPASQQKRDRSDEQARGRKRRRLQGEDDTDRDIRYAREDAESGQKALASLRKHPVDDAPLHDHAGHIQLVPALDERARDRPAKNPEFEAEKARKKKREEDQVTMRFSNAAGYQNGMQKPWYATGKDKDKESDENLTRDTIVAVENKNGWGNEDPLRRQREQNRVTSSDPLAFMQQAQRQLQRSQRDREQWKSERLAETEDSHRKERRKHRERIHVGDNRRSDDRRDSLDGFSLDATPNDDRRSRHHDRHKRHRRHRERSQRSKD